MGAKDIVTKDYMDDCVIFADAFNQYIYKGEQVIDPKKLRSLDTAIVGVPYGAEGAGVPVQKFRDGLKGLTAMADGETVYLLMAVENQAEINYAMPVKDMVYDALQYAAQVEKAAKSHKAARKKAREDEHMQRKKVTAGEYLSGFHKDDRLIPVITLVLYFNAGEWDGPMSLHEMMAVKNPEILTLVSDYRINLIAPGNMSDEEINRFTTSLREVMMFIKYSKQQEKLQEILQTDERFKRVDRKAATVIRTVTGTEFEMDEEEEKVDMCEAIQGMVNDAKKEGMQQGMQTMIHNLMQSMNISLEKACELLKVNMSECEAVR